jgi:hypothetical protein
MLQGITAIANSIRNITPEDSPSLPVSPRDPALVDPTTPTQVTPAKPLNASPEVSFGFRKADDYSESRKATCMYCGKTLKATHGTTSTMLTHLTAKHSDMFATPDGVVSLDR